jgi:hypothetical protein
MAASAALGLSRNARQGERIAWSEKKEGDPKIALR